MHPHVVLAPLMVVFAVAGFLAGDAGSAGSGSNPTAMLDSIPVGVQHSPAGAVAAADNYVAVEQQTVERDPARFAALVAAVYSDGIRSNSLATARADRLRDGSGMSLWARGGESFTVIGAHRLNSYGANGAVVTTWGGQVLWGPGQSPVQVWALGQTTLRWSHSRWLVSSMSTLAAPGPAPAATPQANSGDDTARVFDTLLRGFGPVAYGAPDQ